VQDIFTVPVAEIRERSQATLPAAFGPTVSEPVSA
jgi:phosphoribosylformylglycinamidine synthase